MRNMKGYLIPFLLLAAGFLLLLSAFWSATDLATKHDSVADRVAKCVIEEYEAHPERKAIEEYCRAKVRLE